MQTLASQLAAAQAIPAFPHNVVPAASMVQNVPVNPLRSTSSLANLAAALSKAQGAMQAALKDTSNPFFKSKYADLAAVWGACRKPLADNGLSVIQMPADAPEGYVSLSTLLLHESGEYIGTSVKTPVAKTPRSREDPELIITPQSIGSALTYLRRYSLAAMVGIVADEDDDGNSASGNVASARPKHAPGAVRDALEADMREKAGTDAYKLIIGTIDTHHRSGNLTSSDRAHLLAVHKELTK